MAIPKMCDNEGCKELAASAGNDHMRMQAGLPVGWFYVSVTRQLPDNSDGVPSTSGATAEVCSQRCALEFLTRQTAPVPEVDHA